MKNELNLLPLSEPKEATYIQKPKLTKEGVVWCVLGWTLIGLILFSFAWASLHQWLGVA